jgi:hypothetical protein
MFLRNVGWLSTDYTTLYPRRQYSLFILGLLNDVFSCSHCVVSHNILRSDEVNWKGCGSGCGLI